MPVGEGVAPHEGVAVTVEGASADGERKAYIELSEGPDDEAVASRSEVNGCTLLLGGWVTAVGARKADTPRALPVTSLNPESERVGGVTLLDTGGCGVKEVLLYECGC